MKEWQIFLFISQKNIESYRCIFAMLRLFFICKNYKTKIKTERSKLSYGKKDNKRVFTTNEFDGSEVVTGERTNNSFSNPLPQLTAMYCVGPGQTTATAVSRNDPVNAYFSLKTEGRGKIQINKHAEQGDSQGMVFNISGNGINMDVTINSGNGYDGYVVVDDLRPGTYTVTEKATGEKYYVEPDYQYTTVTPNNTSNVWFSNNLKRGNIEVRKNAEDGIKSGYQFNISGTAIDGETINETITTNAEGVATKEGLPIGTYTVKELNCPSYMVVPSDQTVTVKYNETSSVTFDNKYKRGDLVLSKTDAETGDIILADDAVFAVSEYNKNTNEYDFVCNLSHIPSDVKYPVEFNYAGQSVLAVTVTANDGNAVENDIIRGKILGHKVDDDGNSVANATMGLFSTTTTEFTKDTAYLVSKTDENGAFVFDNVPYGDYIVREIEAPEGFVLSEKSTPVSVTDNAQTVEIKVLNSIITGNVTVTKVDKEYKDKNIAGAVFDIYLDVNANETYDEGVDTYYGTMTDNHDGTYIAEGLRYNGYFLHEKTAPEGFVADDEYYYFEIRNNNETVTVSNNDENTFEDCPIIGTVEITKTDVATGALIPNAGFRIYDADGNVVAEGYTDENGVATFTLRYGKYTYQEFDAAPGYILDETSHEFEIKEDGEIVKADMTNEAIPAVEIPQTGTAGKAIGAFTGLSALSVIGVYFVKKKKSEA